MTPQGLALSQPEYDADIKVVFLESKLNNMGKCSYITFKK